MKALEDLIKQEVEASHYQKGADLYEYDGMLGDIKYSFVHFESKLWVEEVQGQSFRGLVFMTNDKERRLVKEVFVESGA